MGVSLRLILPRRLSSFFFLFSEGHTKRQCKKPRDADTLKLAKLLENGCFRFPPVTAQFLISRLPTILSVCGLLDLPSPSSDRPLLFSASYYCRPPAHTHTGLLTHHLAWAAPSDQRRRAVLGVLVGLVVGPTHRPSGRPPSRHPSFI